MFPFVSIKFLLRDRDILLKELFLFFTLEQTQEDYTSMLQALETAKRSFARLRVLWKVVRCEGVVKEEASYVRQVEWVPSVEEVYTHPSVKVVVHHGGGKDPSVHRVMRIIMLSFCN